MDQAIVLAAGEGQRLRPLTVNRPKVMLPIGNKPILQYVLEAVAANGIRRIILIVGFKKEQVQDYFGSGASLGIDITYVEQKLQLGTGHALKQAERLADDSFLVISGDNIVRPSTIAPLLTIREQAILVKPGEDVSKYGVTLVREGLVTEITEKAGPPGSNLINTGIYKFNRDIFSALEGEVDLPSVINRMAEKGMHLEACLTSDVWLDAVYPWDMLRLNASVLDDCVATTAGKIEPGVVIKGRVSIGEGSIIRAGCYLVGPCAIGNHCEMGPYASIFPHTSIGSNVVLGSYCSVRNCIIGSNVHINASSHVEDTIIAQGSRLGCHFVADSGNATVHIEDECHKVDMGAVVGELTTVGPSVTLRPGTILGNRCAIEPLNVVQNNVPDGSRIV